MYCTVVQIYCISEEHGGRGTTSRALLPVQCQLGHARMRAVLAHRGARPRDIRMLPM